MVNAIFFWEQNKKQQTNKQETQTINWGQQKELNCLIMNIKKHKDFQNVSWKCSSLWVYVCKESYVTS